jgi:hypothetical protein
LTRIKTWQKYIHGLEARELAGKMPALPDKKVVDNFMVIYQFIRIR